VTASEMVAEGRRVILAEAAAVVALADRIGEDFARACVLIANADRIVVCGLGKSGHIARKIASTLSSTGTPATFLHAGEALHGDLGAVRRGDVAVVLSNSGGGYDIARLAEALVCARIPIVAMTGRSDSTLASAAAVVLDCSTDEACPLGLAPTSSSTTALVLGDALAMTAMALSGFGADDFAERHPGGSLGAATRVAV